MGGDLKYGITSNLTVDATVNPDFGQVEADPSVVNLSAFETFFPEKRPFFLEGQGLFRFDLNCNDGSCSGLFYSRRIGRGPQLSGEYNDVTNPASSTILGATKLTGRLGNGVSVGVMDAVTQRESAPGNRTIEPATNYFVGRAQRDFRQGASSIGTRFTSVGRNVDQWSKDFLRSSSYAGGLDFRHQFHDRNFEVSGYYAQSLVEGSASPIARTQRSSVHYVAKRGGGSTLFSTGFQISRPVSKSTMSAFSRGRTRRPSSCGSSTIRIRRAASIAIGTSTSTNGRITRGTTPARRSAAISIRTCSSRTACGCTSVKASTPRARRIVITAHAAGRCCATSGRCGAGRRWRVIPDGLWFRM